MSDKNKKTATGKTQNEVIKSIAEKTGLTVVKVREVVEAQAALAISELKDSGVFVLAGIGKLKAKESAARQGRNPRTGETVDIPARSRIVLTMTKGFKDSVQ